MHIQCMPHDACNYVSTKSSTVIAEGEKFNVTRKHPSAENDRNVNEPKLFTQT